MPMLGVGRDLDWQTGDLHPLRLCRNREVWCEWPCFGTLSLCDGVTHEAKDDAEKDDIHAGCSHGLLLGCLCDIPDDGLQEDSRSIRLSSCMTYTSGITQTVACYPGVASASYRPYLSAACLLACESSWLSAPTSSLPRRRRSPGRPAAQQVLVAPCFGLPEIAA